MSAAAKIPSYFHIHRPLDESQLLLELSSLTNKELEIGHLLDSVADLVLALPGVRRVTIEPVGNSSWRSRCRGGKPHANAGTAVAPIAAGGGSWGTVRIYFGLTPVVLASPVRLAVFVGQQLARALTRIRLSASIHASRRAIDALQTRLARRKYVERAAGKISERAGIPQADAVRYLIAQARRRKRPLLEVSAYVLSFFEARPLPATGAEVVELELACHQ